MEKKRRRADESIHALSNDCIEFLQCRSASDAVIIIRLRLRLSDGIDTLQLYASRGCSSTIDAS